MTQDELRDFFEEMGEPGFRAAQIFLWIHGKRVGSWSEMSDLPKTLRERLETERPLDVIETVRVQESREDGTKKYLFRLGDGRLVESVLMRYSFGDSVCVSSQAGCAMGCKFCASTLNGLERSLTAGEMLSQIYEIEKGLPEGERVSHTVVMGSGEPMENYGQTVRFLRLLSDKRGKNMSLRSMTVSTCGVVPGIRRLAGEGLPVNLAVSLHAPDDEIRRRIMPIAMKYTIDEIIDACRFYYERTGRRLTWEYALIKGVNDAPEHAEGLAKRLKGTNSLVNLIPMNPVRERELAGSDMKTVKRFQAVLRDRGQEATIRRSLGRDIDGACGQLKNRTMPVRFA